MLWVYLLAFWIWIHQILLAIIQKINWMMLNFYKHWKEKMLLAFHRLLRLLRCIQEWFGNYSPAEHQHVDTFVQLWLVSAGKVAPIILSNALNGQRSEIGTVFGHAMNLINHAKGLKDVSDTQSKTRDAFDKTGI